MDRIIRVKTEDDNNDLINSIFWCLFFNSVLSGEQRPSTQIFEASEVLECDKKQRKKSATDVSNLLVTTLCFVIY